MPDPSRGQQEKTRQYIDRTYRDFSRRANLTAFCVKWKETDLYIRAESDLSGKAMEIVLDCRRILETHIQRKPMFLTSLRPLPPEPDAPAIIREMLDAARLADVGPMAAVAGAVAEHVGRALMDLSGEVIVENGGDIFLWAKRPITVSIFAGASPLSGKVGIEIQPADMPCGVCTSSGTVGPSLSFGKADAVTVRAGSAVLADAAVTALANRIREPEDIEPAIENAGGIPGILGVVAILGDRVGIWGDMNLVRLRKNDEQGKAI